MPGQGGLETLRIITEWESHPPVIYVTGAEDSRLAVAALKAGASDYVMKSDAAVFFELLDGAIRQSLDRVAITRQKEAAAREVGEANTRLEALVVQQQAMLREVNHRVSNSLQIVGALVRLQASAAESDAVRRALLDTQGRIEAIAHVHRHLYTSTNVERVELGQYLTSLTESLEQSLALDERNIQVRRQMTAVSVPTDTAVSIGVIIAELFTNAFKYAYEGRDGGELILSLFPTAGEGIRIAVTDNGVGFGGGGKAEGTGVGSKIVGSMARSLQAELGVQTGPFGTAATLYVPQPG
jgi:two-component sensor histidine kinase